MGYSYGLLVPERNKYYVFGEDTDRRQYVNVTLGRLGKGSGEVDGP